MFGNVRAGAEWNISKIRLEINELAWFLMKNKNAIIIMEFYLKIYSSPIFNKENHKNIIRLWLLNDNHILMTDNLIFHFIRYIWLKIRRHLQ